MTPPAERPVKAPLSAWGLEWKGEALYLVDPKGERWRVHDTRYRRFKDHRRPLGHPDANTRYFVRQNGEKRAHTFEKGDVREITLEHVVAHYKKSGYIIGKPFDSREIAPERMTTNFFEKIKWLTPEECVTEK